MDIIGNQWGIMGSCGRFYRQLSIFCGNFMDIDGYLWIFMDTEVAGGMDMDGYCGIRGPRTLRKAL